jgi:hypothetical protein
MYGCGKIETALTDRSKQVIYCDDSRLEYSMGVPEGVYVKDNGTSHTDLPACKETLRD